jgi:hypothetical protein
MEILSGFCNVEYTPICKIYKKNKHDLYTPTVHLFQNLQIGGYSLT